MDIEAIEIIFDETRTFFRYAIGELLRANAPDDAIVCFMGALQSIGCAKAQLASQGREILPRLEGRPLSLQMTILDGTDANAIEKIVLATRTFMRRAIGELLIADAPDASVSLFVEALQSVGYAYANLIEQGREDPLTALAALEQRLLSLQQSVELVLQKVETPKEPQYLD